MTSEIWINLPVKDVNKSIAFFIQIGFKMNLDHGSSNESASFMVGKKGVVVMLFDEATSALDSITEEDITATIREISARKEQITLLIAHRLSTIMHADRIYVLEKGVIIETGSHEELIAEKGLYYAMWRQQIGERA